MEKECRQLGEELREWVVVGGYGRGSYRRVCGRRVRFGELKGLRFVGAMGRGAKRICTVLGCG